MAWGRGLVLQPDDLRAAFAAAFPTSDYPDANARPIAAIIAYDDLTPIDKSIVWDSNGNGRMWLEARGVFSSKAAIVRTQVERKVTTTSAIQPGSPSIRAAMSR